MGFDYGTYIGLGKQTLGGCKQDRVHTRTQEKGAVITQDWPRVAYKCTGVSSRGEGQQWPAAAGSGELNTRMHAQDLLKDITIIFITPTIVWSMLNHREGTQPYPSTENWIKDLLSTALQNKNQFPPQSVSHQEDSLSLLALPIREQTEWKPQLQKTNQKLITWTTAVSNSVKLLAKLWRANQYGRVTVEISDKTWSTGEGNGKPLLYSCHENPMNTMKMKKKIWHWKTNSPGH